MLEIVRTPRATRQYGWMLWTAQQYACDDLVRMRSPAFARVLKEWIAGKDRMLAAEAGMFLAWMGRDQDVSFLRRQILEGQARLVAHIASGIELAIRHKHVGKDFKEHLVRELTAYITGERQLLRGTAEDRIKAYSAITAMLVIAGRRKAIKLLGGTSVLNSHNPAIRAAVLQLTFEAEEDPSLCSRAGATSS
jgi:hypothetical protein